MLGLMFLSPVGSRKDITEREVTSGGTTWEGSVDLLKLWSGSSSSSCFS